jgi:hypothetical protein
MNEINQSPWMQIFPKMFSSTNKAAKMSGVTVTKNI